MNELLVGLGGTILGAVLTYFASVRLADREQRRRRDDEARDLVRRQGEMRVALTAALERNVALLRKLPDAFGKMNVPPSVDVVALEATTRHKYGLLDVRVCDAVDVAHGKLLGVQRAMDHLAETYAQGVASATSRTDASIDSRKALLADITDKHVPTALKSCDAALVALRGFGAKQVEPAKPPKPAGTTTAREAATEAPGHGGG